MGSSQQPRSTANRYRHSKVYLIKPSVKLKAVVKTRKDYNRGKQTVFAFIRLAISFELCAFVLPLFSSVVYETLSLLAYILCHRKVFIYSRAFSL